MEPTASRHPLSLAQLEHQETEEKEGSISHKSKQDAIKYTTTLLSAVTINNIFSSEKLGGTFSFDFQEHLETSHSKISIFSGIGD